VINKSGSGKEDSGSFPVVADANKKKYFDVDNYSAEAYNSDKEIIVCQPGGPAIYETQ